MSYGFNTAQKVHELVGRPSYIRTNVRTNGPSNRHTDDCVLIHKMAYSAFIFIKEDFFYLSKRSRPR